MRRADILSRLSEHVDGKEDNKDIILLDPKLFVGDKTATALPVKGNYFPIFHSHLHTRPMASDLFHCGFHYRPRVFRLLGPISEDRGVSSVLPNADRNWPRRILPI